jgi:TonB family protein
MFSIGVIPLFQSIPTVTQLTAPERVEASRRETVGGGEEGLAYRRTVVVSGTTGDRIFHPFADTDENSDRPPNFDFGSADTSRPPIGNGQDKGNRPGVRLEEEKKRPRLSHIDEGLLTQKVMPVYPLIASRIGLQGDVKLYAVISREGSIESLKLISGHPLLVAAAMDAVKQWKYRPYILNGDPVEVETYITVTFRKGN